ncbi:sensor histidine kinase [Leucobacter denitrificans]|uniref:Sensor-like histidine kinase SenX3 n=1 Tax=Leucobacter denitrificans TaxID=683042 RepID=A0A7G9S3U6_9MICO|nr:ATP-binding protein [Leucobacter denitrificans]QNN62521.1 ATP-binding protein [Leucobacter denitrificans]
MLPLAELPKRHGLPEIATTILEGIDTFAVIFDSTLTPVFANAAARRSETISGSMLQSPMFMNRAQRVLETGVPSSRDPHPDDPRDTVRTHLMRIEPDLIVLLAQDLGEEQRLNAMRRDFIANVSHELKTPIAAIGLLSEAVREAADNPQLVRDFASSLIKESKRLANLSQDIIQLSEAQSQLRPESLEKVQLRTLVREEVEAHEGFAAQHGVNLVLIDESDPKRKASIHGRASALASALANVLSNAIRHSPEGGTVKVRMSHRKRNFAVSIRDNGEGIAPEHQERIFERFYRVDTARSRTDGGTGLGLSIARHSLRAHGGDITLRSEVGKGARFTLTFPLGDAPKKRREKSVKRARKALKQLTETKGHE